MALDAERIRVEGSVFLRQEFTADGAVWLNSAQIGGDLSCGGGAFTELKAQTATIKGNLFFQEVRHAERPTVDLTNATVGTLVDDETSWPPRGSLYLDGFVFDRLAPSTADAGRRLPWLHRQRSFTTRPYVQLANALREMGHDREARKVLYEMERLSREKEAPSFFERLSTGLSGLVSDRTAGFRGWVLKWTIGYGIYPLRVVWWLVGFVLSGTMLFHFGYAARSMTPTDEKAYTYFKQFQSPPIYYQRFNSFIYSLENSAPVLKLGQDSAWTPDPAPGDRRHRRLRRRPLCDSSAGFRL